MTPRVLYLLPASSLHGGIRVALEQAEGLARRGYAAAVAGPEPAPSWHPLRVPYHRVPLDRPRELPPSDIVIATFWTTVEPAVASGAPHVFHFSQGFEGVHREYAPILDRIDAAYRLPIPKLLVSAHLEPILTQRYGCRCHFLGQFVDSERFSPARRRERSDGGLRVGVVGPFSLRPKGIPSLLEGFARARATGRRLEVHHASAEPLGDDEASLGVVDHHFHHLSTQEMPDFYRRLDAYFHPSFDEEGFPLPPLEAMACGVAVAVSRIRSFLPLPDDAVVRFTPGEPEAVVEALGELDDPNRRDRMAAAGRRYAEEQTLDRVLDRLVAAFEAEGAPVPPRQDQHVRA